MSELTRLTYLRKHHTTLLKLFFSEIHKGKPLPELSELRQLIDNVQLEIAALEKELNISTGDADS